MSSKVASSSQSSPGGELQGLRQTRVQIVTLLQTGRVTCNPSLSEHYLPGGENGMVACLALTDAVRIHGGGACVDLRESRSDDWGCLLQHPDPVSANQVLLRPEG